ncbi:MAG TPA: helix-turn-helix domain-containing protein [Blastocatellia bacterium]|nr:helix-turn-helix domain-containing protein [Blastocatellia bacterium]
MQYEEFRPAAPLAKYVKCFWVLEAEAADSPNQERILPDGCAEIVFQLADPFNQLTPDGTTHRQPLAMLVGQMRRHLLIQPTGRVRVMGVRFWPGGAYPFLDVPQNEILDRIVGLDAVWGKTTPELQSRIADAETASESVKQLEAVLLARLKQFRRHDEAALQATALILRAGGRLSIDALTQELGINSRRLDRTFSERIGLPPKTLCRIVRFQQVFKRLERQAKNLDWLRIALDCGYYDQSHFIKEFKFFSGRAPTSYLAEQNPMSDHFIASS